jgi:O-succinylbenzoic acid--CoA ligase
MQPISAWLTRTRRDTPAIILPDGGILTFGDIAVLPRCTGLQLLDGNAATLAQGIVACALGGGTAFPLPPGLDSAQRARITALAEQAAEPGLALIIATSGSQGEPKGVRLPWRAVAAASRMSMKSLGLEQGDAWLACLPLYHVGGAMILYRCLRAGATAVVHDSFDPESIARDLTERRITHLSLVPPMLSSLIDAAVPPGPTLRCVLVGGAALTQTLYDRAVAAGWPVCPTYGMTETCAQATVNLRPGKHWREGDVGRPLPGVRIESTEDGRLRIATPARMSGYLGDAGPAPEWIATNDLGSIDANGHVHVDGRADDMLVSAGVNVHPLDVESRLATCPGVREAGVTGLADPVWGDVIAAAYEGEAEEEAIETWCRDHLPGTRRPRRFLRVERLPRLPSGKLDRKALPMLWSRPA